VGVVNFVINMAQIAAVLFDLDETLLDRTQSLTRFVQAQYQRFFPHCHHIPPGAFRQRFVELDAHGTVWKDKVYQQLLAEQKFAGVGWEELLNDYVDHFADSCVGFPHLHTMLDALAVRGYRLGIVTNGRSPFQERNIAALGIRHYFGAVLVSEAERVRKPDPEIFLRAAARLQARVDEVVFIGDNPQADIAGAQRCGMKAIWFAPRAVGECAFADAVCNGLHELADLVEGMGASR
jgi:putative hydrolase of the HAD superfamily